MVQKNLRAINVVLDFKGIFNVSTSMENKIDPEPSHHIKLGVNRLLYEVHSD